MTLSKEDVANAGEKPEDYRITRENEHWERISVWVKTRTNPYLSRALSLGMGLEQAAVNLRDRAGKDWDGSHIKGMIYNEIVPAGSLNTSGHLFSSPERESCRLK